MRRLAALAVLCGVVVASAQSPSAVEQAVQRFLAAPSPAEALAQVDAVMAAQAGFDDLYARLKKGRAYGEVTPSEMAYRWRSSKGVMFRNTVEVPDSYDPAKPWMLRVQLHGGIGRPSPNAGGRDNPGAGVNRIAGENQIYIHPSAWLDAQWWDAEQVDNILRLVDVVKRRYNVNENQVYLTGISDGGTGAYYLALKEPTLWSSVLPLNGSLAVLRNPQNGADGDMHGNNLLNTPLFIVNGENDPLYPVSQVEPHVQWLERMGVLLQFRPQRGAGHNTAWWPTEREPYERFVHARVRQPHPARVTWETEREDRFNRMRWLVVTGLRTPGGDDARLDDTGFFPRTLASGRVDVTRAGNTFDATTRGVASFSLLLSPDVVDFAKTVTVTVNGRPVFSGSLKKDAETLLKWAAKDNDRTMLYGAEIAITVP